MLTQKFKVSVVVPVLNELSLLERNVDHYRTLEKTFAELIFVDGGSTDGSREFLQERFARVCESESGRAAQMNFGAKQAKQTVVLFLHADTQLPEGSVSDAMIAATWGFYSLRLSGERRIFRVVETGINLRSRVFSVATGDQCLFFNRDLFLQTGGFVNQALMEDIEISRRFKRIARPLICRNSVVTSSRRWEKRGVVRTVVQMWTMQLLYKLGVSVNRLASWYYGDKRKLDTKNPSL